MDHHCLLVCNISDKPFLFLFFNFYVCFSVHIASFFSECFQYFIISFQQFDHDVSYCGIPHVSSLWGSLSLLNLEFIIFIKFEKNFAILFFPLLPSFF